MRSILPLRWFALLFLAAGLARAADSTPVLRAITAEDIWSVKRPAALELSPDGARLVFTVKEFNLEKNSSVSHLWVLDTASGAAHALTTAESSDNAPTWSPDGSRIAFTAKRNGDEEAALYVIRADGGEAEKIIELPLGISAPRWLPDGQHVVFATNVLPKLASDREAMKKELKKKKDSKVTALATENAVLKRALARLRAEPAPLGRARRIVTGVLVSLVALLSLNPVVNMLSPSQRMNAAFDPFDLVNTYGAFGSVNRTRNEVVLEGTRDQTLDEHTRWLAFELPCKPGDPARRPCFAAPYQYKLDWQMWFASFSSAGQEPWLIHLVSKLLRGDPVVDSLFSSQPFRGRPPRYVRALFYRYEFADPEQDGVYWRRHLVGEYLRPLSLGDGELETYLVEHGFAE